MTIHETVPHIVSSIKKNMPAPCSLSSSAIGENSGEGKAAQKPGAASRDASGRPTAICTPHALAACLV